MSHKLQPSITFHKSTFVIIICMLFIMSLVFLGNPINANNTNIYEDDLLGISFSYPDGWEVRSAGSRIESRTITIEHFSILEASDNSEDNQSSYQKIEITLVPFTKPSDILLENWIEPSIENAESTTFASRLLGNYETFEIQDTPLEDSSQSGSSIYVTNSKNTLLIATYGAQAATYHQILDNILLSLNFGEVLNSTDLPSVTQLGGSEYSLITSQDTGSISATETYMMPLGARHTLDVFPVPAPGTADCSSLGCYYISQGPNGNFTHNKPSTTGALDFLAETGTRVYASRTGYVIRIGYHAPGSGYGGFGNIVLIQHSDGSTTLYAHLSDWVHYPIGTLVAKGAWIGRVGDSGWQDAGFSSPWPPHLHFHARDGVNVTDPPLPVKNIEGIFWKNNDADSVNARGYAYGPPVLFSEPGFTGNSQAFPESVSNLLDQENLGGVGNDRASSLDWQYPWTFIMYGHKDAGLPAFLGQGDIANFSNYTFSNGISLNENVSSVTARLNSCPVPGIGPLSSTPDNVNSINPQEPATISCQPVPADLPIDPVSLLSPGDGQYISFQPVNFIWSIAPISGLEGYQLLVKTNSDMESGGSILLNVFTSSTSYSFTFNPNITIAYWSVRPKANGVYGPWAYVNGHTSSIGFSTSVPTPTPQPPPVASGWNQYFYSDNNLGSRCGDTRIETDIYMFRDSDTGWSPPSGCPGAESAWSVRMERNDAYFQGGYYQFGLFYDDGARLYVDGNLAVDGWVATQHYESHYVSPGNHTLRLEYKNNAGHAIVQLWWQGPGALPGYDEVQDPNQWWANYWGNQTKWQDSVGRRNEGTGFLDHNWGDGNPGFGLPSDHFSTSFERTVGFECGTYRFHLRSDDGSRLFIDGILIPAFDHWSTNVWDTSADIAMTKAFHVLKVDHFENGGGASIYLDWILISSCPPPSPGAFGKISPSQSETGMGTSVLLTWQSANPVTSYEFCYSTSLGCTNWINVGSDTYATLTGLNYASTYFWQVRALNGTAQPTLANAGAYWSFSTNPAPPGDFNKTSPANAAPSQPTNPTLSWGSSERASSYVVCYDTINDSLCNTYWLGVDNSQQLSLSGLVGGTQYYWQVKALNAAGDKLANSGTWWSFTTAPAFLAFRSFLPIVNGPLPMRNANFEEGHVAWTENSSSGFNIIENISALSHSGSWVAWLGGGNNETSTLSQSISIPSQAPYMHYWYSDNSEDICGYDFFRIKVNGAQIFSKDLCASNGTGGWIENVLNLSAYAGTTITIAFEVTTDVSNISSAFVDDIVFSASSLTSLDIEKPVNTNIQFIRQAP